MAKKRGKKDSFYCLSATFAFSYLIVILLYFLLVFLLIFFGKNFGMLDFKYLRPVFVLYIFVGLSIVLAVVAYHMITVRIFNPLKNLSKASKRITEGQYDIQVPYDGRIEELNVAISNFNQMAKELNSVEMIRNDFVANVSHEFKTPLSSIKGYVTLLQDEELSKKERELYIEKINFQVDKLNQLTENILRLSKLENQTYDDSEETYRLDEQVREAIVLQESKWMAKEIELDIHMDEVTFTGKQGLLLQVWMNLISNAIKFSEVGGTVTIVVKEKSETIQVLVSDEGLGMDESTMNHIFEKFYQGDTSRKEQGNGLGLPLCKEILAHCNGKILVSSEKGQGSTFMVELKNKREK